MKSPRTSIFSRSLSSQTNGLFVATNPALAGCYSQGRSMEEALTNVREATEACIVDRADIHPSNISVHVISV